MARGYADIAQVPGPVIAVAAPDLAALALTCGSAAEARTPVGQRLDSSRADR
jgi:hypothetical protein